MGKHRRKHLLNYNGKKIVWYTIENTKFNNCTMMEQGKDVREKYGTSKLTRAPFYTIQIHTAAAFSQKNP